MTQTNVKRLSNYVKRVSIPQGDARLKLRFESLTWLWDVWHALSLDSNISNMSNLICLSQDSNLSQTIRFANSNAYQTPSTLYNTASILTGHNTCSLIEGGRNAPLCVTRSHPISPARTLLPARTRLSARIRPSTRFFGCIKTSVKALTQSLTWIPKTLKRYCLICFETPLT